MARIPTAFNSGLGQQLPSPAPTPFQSLNTSADLFGAAQGRTLQNAGAEITALGGEMAARQEQIELANDRAAAGRAFMASRKDTEEKLLENIYGKPGGELFAKGAGAGDVYKSMSPYFGASSKIGEGLLANDRQKQLFAGLWGPYQSAEESRAATHIGIQHRHYLTDVSNAQAEDAQELLSGLASRIEQDWRKADRIRDEGHMQITAREVVGLSEQAALALDSKWEDTVSASAVRGWFSEQSDQLTAVESLITGDIKDKNAKKYWESLDARHRKRVQTELISRTQKMVMLANDQREFAQKERERQTSASVIEFFVSTGDDGLARRNEIYESVKNNPGVKPATRKAMRDTLFGGEITEIGKEGSRVLLAEVTAGNIKTVEEANIFEYRGQRPATNPATQSEVHQLIEQMQNTDFAGALAAGRSGLGMNDRGSTDRGTAASGVLSQRGEYFENSFRRYMTRNPEADPWEASARIEKEARGKYKSDPAARGRLRILRKRYNDDVKAGNALAAQITRHQADGLLNVLGLTWEDSDE